MPNPDYQGAIAYSLHRLETELSPILLYHSYWHTREDVMAAAIRLGQMSCINGVDLQLLEVAAAFHDIGYLFTHTDHEIVGARLAEEVLVDFGFNPAQIERVVSMIMATRLPQSPQDLIEAILADADLDVLGREDFFERSELLRQEYAALGQLIPPREWAESQLRFLQQHAYHTPAAIDLRQALKLANIASLEARLNRF